MGQIADKINALQNRISVQKQAYDSLQSLNTTLQAANQELVNKLDAILPDEADKAALAGVEAFLSN